jgi:hypothetical protein
LKKSAKTDGIENVGFKIIAPKLKINMQTKIFLLTAACCFFILSTIAQTGAKMPPNDWTLYSAMNEATSFKDTIYLEKRCIKLDGNKVAVAVKNGQRYKNFRIECDIAGRVMSGIGFRTKDHQNYHFLYFRPGYGGTQEAIQYIPVINGTLGWVFYNYPMYEKTADIQSLQWFHAGIEVRGNVMQVFVNNSKEPQMEINLVETDFDEGNILLRTMFGESYFANVVIRELPELLSDWEISEQFPRKETLDLNPTTASSKWAKVKPDASKVVNIARYFENPNGVVIARHSLKADAAKDMLLYFDFVGKLKIFLNGKELFYYEKLKLDRIFPGTERILLQLNKGNNELVFVCEGDAMIFGKGFNAMGRAQHQNWGFIAEIGKR